MHRCAGDPVVIDQKILAETEAFPPLPVSPPVMFFENRIAHLSWQPFKARISTAGESDQYAIRYVYADVDTAQALSTGCNRNGLHLPRVQHEDGVYATPRDAEQHATDIVYWLKLFEGHILTERALLALTASTADQKLAWMTGYALELESYTRLPVLLQQALETPTELMRENDVVTIRARHPSYVRGVSIAEWRADRAWACETDLYTRWKSMSVPAHRRPGTSVPAHTPPDPMPARTLPETVPAHTITTTTTPEPEPLVADPADECWLAGLD